jgi:phospholipase/carboxylesterase
MGAVMSYAMGLGADRPAVAGILAFSGFVPTVEGWEPSLADRTGTRAFVSHGRNDPVIGIEFAERARELLSEGGLDLTYRESELGHQIDPAHLREASAWLDEVL